MYFFMNTLREENMSDTLWHNGYEENNDKVAGKSNSHTYEWMHFILLTFI